jgi:alkaline phosphatase D
MTIQKLPRRLFIKLLGIATLPLVWMRSGNAQTAQFSGSGPNTFSTDWQRTRDRTWLGESFWANPMEDWAVVDGGAEVRTGGGDRNIQLITHQWENPQGDFEMSVQVQRIENGSKDGGAGFRLGIQSDINEYRANCFANSGLDAGVIDGQLTLGKATKAIQVDPSAGYRLILRGKSLGNSCELTLSAVDASHNLLGTLTQTVQADSLKGNVALVSNFNTKLKNDEGARSAERPSPLDRKGNSAPSCGPCIP